jgi:hypothetical protein
MFDMTQVWGWLLHNFYVGENMGSRGKVIIIMLIAMCLLVIFNPLVVCCLIRIRVYEYSVIWSILFAILLHVFDKSFDKYEYR